MKNQNLRIAAVAVLAGFLSGCAKTASSKVDQTQIYTTYSASFRYGGGEDSASASSPSSAVLRLSANFNVAGPTGTFLELDGSSEVSVNGVSLGSSTDFLNEVIYKNEKDGAIEADAQQSYVFTYTDNNGRQYQNTLSLPPAITVTNAANSSYSRASALGVSWSASSEVASSESLTVHLEKADGSYDVTRQADPSTGATGTITLSVDNLAPATPGNALLSICRGRTGHPAQAPAAGGSLSMTRCSPKVSIVIQ